MLRFTYWGPFIEFSLKSPIDPSLSPLYSLISAGYRTFGWLAAEFVQSQLPKYVPPMTNASKQIATKRDLGFTIHLPLEEGNMAYVILIWLPYRTQIETCASTNGLKISFQN